MYILYIGVANLFVIKTALLCCLLYSLVTNINRFARAPSYNSHGCELMISTIMRFLLRALSFPHECQWRITFIRIYQVLKKTCINPSDRWPDAAVSGCLFLLPVELNTQENKGVMLPLGKCPFLKNAWGSWRFNRHHDDYQHDHHHRYHRCRHHQASQYKEWC